MPRRQRDYAAERAGRDAKYQALGYPSYNAFENLRRQGLAQAGERRQFFQAGGQKIVRSLSGGDGLKGVGAVQAALGRARGRQVKVTVRIDGTRYELFTKGGWNAQKVAQALSDSGMDLAAFGADMVNAQASVVTYLGVESVEVESIEEVQISWS